MSKEILSGMVLDELSSLTLEELSRACSVRTEWIVELVEEGILEPRGRGATAWRFTGSSL
jgi:chaperone modulatory protein CbpM